MIGRVKIIVACWFVTLTAYDVWAQDNAQSLASTIRPAVVSITAYDKDGKVLARGNGFFVSATGLILTRRVLLPATAHRTQATLADGTNYKITGTWAEDKEADLATAQVDLSQKRVKPLTISETIPTVDQRVIIITGGPAEQSTVEAVVSAIQDGLDGKIIQIAGQVGAESSGSPVINLKGEVVGLVRFQKEGHNSCTANTADRLLRLVYPPYSAVQPPKLLNNPEAEYTLAARRAGVEGNVLLRVLIGVDGVVQRVNVTRGLPEGLTDQAIQTAYKMKFKPATSNGQPVQYWKAVVVEFRLRR